MMSEIFDEDFSIRAIASTACDTTSTAPDRRLRELKPISPLACSRALRVVLYRRRHLLPSTAAVCSRFAACSSVRCERSVVLVEISAAEFDTSLEAVLISSITEPIDSRSSLTAFRTAVPAGAGLAFQRDMPWSGPCRAPRPRSGLLDRRAHSVMLVASITTLNGAAGSHPGSGCSSPESRFPCRPCRDTCIDLHRIRRD